MSTVASPLAVGGIRQSGAPVRTQNGEVIQRVWLYCIQKLRNEYYTLGRHIGLIL